MVKNAFNSDTGLLSGLSDIISKPKKNKSRKRANDLDGKTWLQYSISVWNDIKKTSEELRLKHPAMFPSQLPERLIRAFTTDDQKMILDPFMGIGSTLVAAQKLGKHGIGFEISKDYVKKAESRLFGQENIFEKNERHRCKIYNEDVRNLFNHVKRGSIDLCITSPPYWDILTQKRTADYKEVRNYEEQSNNLGMIKDYKTFLKELKGIFAKIKTVIKYKAYCCIIVMDIRKGSRFYPFHMDIVDFMTNDLKFLLDDIIIWDRRLEYSNLRPLGYPSVFRVNKIHEYILIFQKPSEKD